MGLFQKKIVPVSVPRYNLGHQDTKLIVGLGNIGAQYTSTRHNFGFECIDSLAQSEDFSPWTEKKELKSMLCAKIINGKKVILCKPTTFMNLSGEAVHAVQHFYKITSKDTCVLHDDLDIEFGTIRTREGGSDAGNNGVKSLKKHIRDEFWRIRLGIGPKEPAEIDTADFVLQKFSKSQLAQLGSIHSEAHSLLNDWLSGAHQPDTRTI
jgi:PTH1 family peptidyl-tRNA hydrolase